MEWDDIVPAGEVGRCGPVGIATDRIRRVRWLGRACFDGERARILQADEHLPWLIRDVLLQVDVLRVGRGFRPREEPIHLRDRDFIPAGRLRFATRDNAVARKPEIDEIRVECVRGSLVEIVVAHRLSAPAALLTAVFRLLVGDKQLTLGWLFESLREEPLDGDARIAEGGDVRRSRVIERECHGNAVVVALLSVSAAALGVGLVTVRRGVFIRGMNLAVAVRLSAPALGARGVITVGSGAIALWVGSSLRRHKFSQEKLASVDS
ncbi:hypothetical protein [Halococcus saccharolyticus]|uniref:hypothetical protein n=1 Tax=Halococcus saccharolyticus TaxID=62319 RepID=UPI00137581C4|nr:hypothetical protein [Halococcus saccharolyticus]